MGLLNSIKNDVKKSGQNKGKFIYFREGQKVRIRFLQDMDDGLEVLWHDSFELGINVPCQEIFGRECEYCNDDTLRTRKQYCWSVWNYEAKEVQLFMFAVNNCSPIPSLVAMYENYGTLMDRDYVISVSGKQQNKTFSVVPMDPVKFRNDKAKPFAKKSVLRMIDKAWPDENADAEDYEEEDEVQITKTRKKKKPAIKSGKAKSKSTYDDEEEYEDDYENDEFDDEEEVEGQDYSEMSAVELFKLCKERGLEVAKRKPERYYIRLLEEDDAAHEDWEDGDEEDEWEDE